MKYHIETISLGKIVTAGFVTGQGWTVFLLAWNRRRGLRTSGLLTLFWLFSTVFTIAEFRTEINAETYEVRKRVCRYFVLCRAAR